MVNLANNQRAQHKSLKIWPRSNVKLISHLSVTDRCEIQLYIYPLALQGKQGVEKERVCKGSQGGGNAEKGGGEGERQAGALKRRLD